jgi:hypothetical protein
VSAALLTSRRSLVAVASVAVAIELIAAGSNNRDVVRAGREGFDERSSRVRDADLDPLSYFASTEALTRAQQAIPAGDSFAVVIGKNPPLDDPGSVRDVFRFWLQPRRYTTRLSEAQWIVVYHASSEDLKVHYTKELGLGPQANLVRVAP